jgi:hypothetical protein
MSRRPRTCSAHDRTAYSTLSGTQHSRAVSKMLNVNLYKTLAALAVEAAAAGTHHTNLGHLQSGAVQPAVQWRAGHNLSCTAVLALHVLNCAACRNTGHTPQSASQLSTSRPMETDKLMYIPNPAHPPHEIHQQQPQVCFQRSSHLCTTLAEQCYNSSIN